MKTFKTMAITALIAVIVFSMVSCATGARVRGPISGIESVIPGGTLALRISGDQVTVKVSSTEDGTGAVASGTTVSASGVLAVDARETAQNLYITATAADGKYHTLLIRVVTVTEVVITPATATVEAGQYVDFTVKVNGTNNPNQNFTWSVGSNPDGTGSVRAFTMIMAGRLTVNLDEREPLYVKATSDVDPSKSAIVRVTVTAPQPAASQPAKQQPAQQQPAQSQFNPEPNQPAPTGTWRSDQGDVIMTSTYNANGTGTTRLVGGFTDMTFNLTWTASGNKLTVKMDMGGQAIQTTNYTYEISGNTLRTQIEGQTSVSTFTRQ